MKLDTAFETVPDDDDLLYSIEHWDSGRLDDEGAGRSRGDFGRESTTSMVEAFVHSKTGTAARIFKSDSGYSVQPSQGDFGPFDKVIQGDDPSTLVSGGASVVATQIETLSEARAMAYAWMRGWVMRNSSIGNDEGDIPRGY